MLKKETVKKLTELLSFDFLEGGAYYVDLKSFIINNKDYQFSQYKAVKNHVIIGKYQGQAILRKYGNYWKRDDGYDGIEFSIELSFGNEFKTVFSEDVNHDQIFKIIEVMINTGNIYDVNKKFIW